MADLADSERVSSLALPSLPDLLQRGATMNPAFDILKKIGVVNFEWVEVVRDLHTTEAGIQELQARLPVRLKKEGSPYISQLRVGSAWSRNRKSKVVLHI
jgi:hypothetical protein